MANLEQSGSWIPNAESPKLMFSIIATFYLTKTENITKKIFKTALTILLWVKVPFLPKSSDFLQKIADISKIKMALVLKGIFSETP